MEERKIKTFEELTVEEKNVFFKVLEGAKNLCRAYNINGDKAEHFVSFLSGINAFYGLLDTSSKMEPIYRMINNRDFDGQMFSLLQSSVDNLIQHVIKDINDSNDIILITHRGNKDIDIKIVSEEETEFEYRLKEDPELLKREIIYILNYLDYELYEVKEYLNNINIFISRVTNSIRLMSKPKSNLNLAPVNNIRNITSPMCPLGYMAKSEDVDKKE